MVNTFSYESPCFRIAQRTVGFYLSRHEKVREIVEILEICVTVQRKCVFSTEITNDLYKIHEVCVFSWILCIFTEFVLAPKNKNNTILDALRNS